MGAGLGGGSANGAFALNQINQIFQLGITPENLQEYAALLGSDCPFFLVNQPCFVRGRGEIMKTIELDLSVHSIILINPGIHISTESAFSQIRPYKSENSISDIILMPVAEWRTRLLNDFEHPVFLAHPVLKVIKEILYEKGAIYASMTGTGSSLYGIFPKSENPVFNFPSSYFIKYIE